MAQQILIAGWGDLGQSLQFPTIIARLVFLYVRQSPESVRCNIGIFSDNGFQPICRKMVRRWYSFATLLLTLKKFSPITHLTDSWWTVQIVDALDCRMVYIYASLASMGFLQYAQTMISESLMVINLQQKSSAVSIYDILVPVYEFLRGAYLLESIYRSRMIL